MKKYTALLLSLFLVACEPSFASQKADLGNVKYCADKAYRYALLVKYRDASITANDVITIIAPRLDLPKGWEEKIDYVVEEIYKEALTEVQVFDRIYVPCIYGYKF